MKYYMYAENQTVQTLREILEEEAQRNPMWTLQELFAMCRNLSFLDDVPENADYFDEIYLIFAELLQNLTGMASLTADPGTCRTYGRFLLTRSRKRS